jgi:hypothetical protein
MAFESICLAFARTFRWSWGQREVTTEIFLIHKPSIKMRWLRGVNGSDILNMIPKNILYLAIG